MPVLVKSGWVIKVKPHEIRARIVGQQVSDGSTPEEFFTPTPRTMAHRLVMMKALQKKWSLELGDVASAFLHAKMTPEDVYFVIPPESEQPKTGPKHLWRLHRWLYGLRKSPQRFGLLFAEVAGRDGWKRTKADPQLFNNDKYEGALASVHTDDLLFAAAPQFVQAIKDGLSRELTIRWEGAIGDNWVRHLGIEVPIVIRN